MVTYDGVKVTSGLHAPAFSSHFVFGHSGHAHSPVCMHVLSRPHSIARLALIFVGARPICISVLSC